MVVWHNQNYFLPLDMHFWYGTGSISWNLVIKQFVLVKRVDDAFLDNNKRFYAPAVTILMAWLGNNSLRVTKRHFARKKNNPNHSISLPSVHLQVGFNENFSNSAKQTVFESPLREKTREKGFHYLLCILFLSNLEVESRQLPLANLFWERKQRKGIFTLYFVSYWF